MIKESEAIKKYLKKNSDATYNESEVSELGRYEYWMSR